jgi:hypothetical protein
MCASFGLWKSSVQAHNRFPFQVHYVVQAVKGVGGSTKLRLVSLHLHCSQNICTTAGSTDTRETSNRNGIWLAILDIVVPLSLYVSLSNSLSLELSLSLTRTRRRTNEGRETA